MKTRQIIFVATMALAIWGANTAFAQGEPPGTNSPPPVPSAIERPPSGQPAIADRPTVIPPVTAPTPDTPARPSLPGQTTPASGVSDLVKDFQTARETFLKQQQDLLAQLKTASKEEREALRQQLRENMDAWLEQQKAQMQDIRDQAREIKNNVPSISDVVNSGAGEGRDR
jgi:hypothetical protein